MRKNDPYYGMKVYHFASKMNEKGQVSALCYARPRAINLARGQSWTILPEAVTCKQCYRLIAAKPPGGFSL